MLMSRSQFRAIADHFTNICRRTELTATSSASANTATMSKRNSHQIANDFKFQQKAFRGHRIQPETTSSNSSNSSSSNLVRPADAHSRRHWSTFHRLETNQANSRGFHRPPPMHTTHTPAPAKTRKSTSNYQQQYQRCHRQQHRPNSRQHNLTQKQSHQHKRH